MGFDRTELPEPSEVYGLHPETCHEPQFLLNWITDCFKLTIENHTSERIDKNLLLQFLSWMRIKAEQGLTLEGPKVHDLLRVAREQQGEKFSV